MAEVTSTMHTLNTSPRATVGKILLGFLTLTSVVWMLHSLSILYTNAPTFFWHVNAWTPLFGSAWMVFFDPLGPVPAYESYCVSHFNAFFAPLSVVLDNLLTLIYGAIIFRSRALTGLKKCLWIFAIAGTNLILLPVVMPIYFVTRTLKN